MPRPARTRRSATRLSRKSATARSYLDAAGHWADDNDALFRPIRNNRTRRLDKALIPDAVYKLARASSAALGFEIGAHALRATAATNALDHQVDIAKVQEWLGHANIATTRIYDHRKTRPEDSPKLKVAYCLSKTGRSAPFSLFIFQNGETGFVGRDEPRSTDQRRDPTGTASAEVWCEIAGWFGARSASARITRPTASQAAPTLTASGS
ncbi:MAG TPA: site-specific integrase [Burkholderiales bacterium]|nr:site-specific integrase [Burkholderiales bacterium]